MSGGSREDIAGRGNPDGPPGVRRAYTRAMQPPAPFRVVLQTGASAGIARVFAVAFAYGATLAGAMLALMIGADTLESPDREILPLVPVAFLLVSIAAHVAAWRTRATDLALGPDGLVVRGGPHDGLRVGWGEVDPVTTAVVTDGSVVVTINGQETPLARLWLGRRDGSRVALGASTDRLEQRSFAALVTVFREAAGAPAGPVDQGPASVVHCPGCGAPVRPADADAVPCWRCDRVVALPEPVRDRVRVQARHDRHRERVEAGLVALLRQPAAPTANRWLAASIVAPYVLPVAMCVWEGVWLAWLPAALALAAASNLQVARRAAFPGLAVVFAARPGAAPGAPLRCRSCAGPLPEADRVVVACPWCDADNVRALQLDRPAALWADCAGELDGFLAEQEERRTWARRAVAFWVVLALAGLVVPRLE